MSISLVMPDDERAKILVELPHKQKNGHVKTVQIWLPKLSYIPRDIMEAHRAEMKRLTTEYETARKAWSEARLAAVKDKTVVVPDPPDTPTEIDRMVDLARRVIPTEWDKYLEHHPNGVKTQLFSEWVEQSQVNLGESEASSTSSDDQE